MLCIICGHTTEFYLSKTYLEPPFDKFMMGISPVHYHRCTHCGFVRSKTHADLDPVRWAKLNSDCHHYSENPESEYRGNQPPYLEQAMMLFLLGKNGIIEVDDMIDYAAGYGTLSRLLENHFQTQLKIFDPFIQNGDSSRYIIEKDLRTYQTVINSAMFEHILQRDDLDRVNALVANDGCLVIHTVICETVPKDPNWFYIRPPIHTAFHTNKSMGILMDQWGYHSSIYCPMSKCWVLLKKRDSTVADRLKILNEELKSDYFYFKKGFMDYWKGFESPSI